MEESRLKDALFILLIHTLLLYNLWHGQTNFYIYCLPNVTDYNICTHKKLLLQIAVH